MSIGSQFGIANLGMNMSAGTGLISDPEPLVANWTVTVPTFFEGGKLGLNLRGLTVETFYNSNAEELGWKADDTITAVNGVRTLNFDAFAKEMEKVRTENAFPIVFEVYRPSLDHSKSTKPKTKAFPLGITVAATAVCSPQEYSVDSVAEIVDEKITMKAHERCLVTGFVQQADGTGMYHVLPTSETEEKTNNKGGSLTKAKWLCGNKGIFTAAVSERNHLTRLLEGLNALQRIREADRSRIREEQRRLEARKQPRLLQTETPAAAVVETTDWPRAIVVQ